MRYILLSADSLPTLYEAPDKVAERLSDFCFRFLDEINGPESPFVRMMQDASGAEYAVLSYTEMDFLNWLISKEERENIMETARRERYLPCERQQYPWFNF